MRSMLRSSRLAAVAFAAAVFFAGGAKAQTIDCTGPTSGNCVPVVQIAPPTRIGVGSGNAGFPLNSTPTTAFATGTTAGATATLAANATKFNYICGFHYEAGTATAAVTTTLTITGLQGGTFTTSVNSPATAATATAGPIASQVFTPCIPSSLINTAIAVVAGALGAGGVNQAVNAWGYVQ